MASDPNEECQHPEKPEKPYTDGESGDYVLAQGEAIDKCRALLGHGPSVALPVPSEPSETAPD